MNRIVRTILGSLITVCGVAAQLWLWAFAEMSGHGLERAVLIFDVQMPAAVAMFAAFSLCVVGLVVACDNAHCQSPSGT